MSFTKRGYNLSRSPSLFSSMCWERSLALPLDTWEREAPADRNAAVRSRKYAAIRAFAPSLGGNDGKGWRLFAGRFPRKCRCADYVALAKTPIVAAEHGANIGVERHGMNADDVKQKKGRGIRQVFEGIAVTVLGGLLLRYMTVSRSQADPSLAGSLENCVTRLVRSTATPGDSLPVVPAPKEPPAPQVDVPSFVSENAVDPAAVPPPEEIAVLQTATPRSDPQAVPVVRIVSVAAVSDAPLPSTTTLQPSPTPQATVSSSASASTAAESTVVPSIPRETANAQANAPVIDGPELGPAMVRRPVLLANSPLLSMPTIKDAPVPPAKPPAVQKSAAVQGPVAVQRPMASLPTAKSRAVSKAIPVGSILLHENFSRYKDGQESDWGSNAVVRVASDGRRWLVAAVDGVHPVGRSLRLPNTFHWECQCAAGMSEITRGILGWWKEPVSTKISFQNEQGAKYTIEWTVRCGNDVMRLNPLGSPTLYAKKYYHSIKLPDGTAKEIGVSQPTGTLRIDRDNGVVKVTIDGQEVVAGSMNPMGQLVRFEIDVVKAANGMLSFTDFKIVR